MNPLEPGFISFWSSYPRKKSKGDAYKAWGQTKKIRPPVEDILKALSALKATKEWTKDNGEFIPYPATWLRDWGWEDSVEIEAPKVERPSITCIVCRKKSFMWTDGKCDPCWRASQGFRTA